MLAIDVGNSRVKLGRFDRPAECESAAVAGPLPIAGAALPEPTEELTLSPPVGEDSDSSRSLADWLALQTPCQQVVVASVNQSVEAELIDRLESDDALRDARIVHLTNDRLPIEARVDEPDRVGIDRLLAAVAANRLRRAERGAIVVDLGTAITVDLVAPDGAFEGGAILPGIAMGARAMHQQTDALPQSPLVELDNSPDAVGKNTSDAIDSGLFWGAVGAVRELIARQSDRLTQPPQVLLTGGAAPSVARLLGGPEHAVRYVPHLVLAGIAIASDALGDA